MLRDRGLLSEKERLKGIILEAARDRLTMTKFLARLEARGVQVRPNLAKTGHVSGVSYRLRHVAVKGSQLGRAYSWAGLQLVHGVRYDPTRDRPAVERAVRLSQRSTARLPRTRAGFDLSRTLARIAEHALLGQLPEAAPVLRVARAPAAFRRLVATPTRGNAIGAGVRLTPNLDPRVSVLAKILGYALPDRHVRSAEREAPIERERPIQHQAG